MPPRPNLLDAIPERVPGALSPEAVQLLAYIKAQPAGQLKSQAEGALLRDDVQRKKRARDEASPEEASPEGAA